MTLRPDKKKVIDEVWDDLRVKNFLRKSPPDLPGDPDFYVLLFAYQSMRAPDFGRFLEFYQAEERIVTATNGDGDTLARYLKRHKNAGPYIQLLDAATRQSKKARQNDSD